MIVSAHVLPDDPFRAGIGGDFEVAYIERGGTGEHVRALAHLLEPRVVRRGRQPIASLPGHADRYELQLAGGGDRKPPQHHRLDETEDRRIGADAERHRDHSRRR